MEARSKLRAGLDALPATLDKVLFGVSPTLLDAEALVRRLTRGSAFRTTKGRAVTEPPTYNSKTYGSNAPRYGPHAGSAYCSSGPQNTRLFSLTPLSFCCAALLFPTPPLAVLFLPPLIRSDMAVRPCHFSPLSLLPMTLSILLATEPLL